MNALADLEYALRIIQQVHKEMPTYAPKLLRLKVNLKCGIVYLEDGIKDIKGDS